MSFDYIFEETIIKNSLKDIKSFHLESVTMIFDNFDPRALKFLFWQFLVIIRLTLDHIFESLAHQNCQKSL